MEANSLNLPTTTTTTDLAAESDAEGAVAPPSVDVQAFFLFLWATVEGDLEDHELSVPDDLEGGDVTREVVPEHAAELGLVDVRAQAFCRRGGSAGRLGFGHVPQGVDLPRIGERC